MIVIYSAEHALHAPAFEIFRGQKVACFETPERATIVERSLLQRGHSLVAPHIDSRSVLAQVHTPRYLKFLENAWADWLALAPAHEAENAASLEPPYPSVWPIRTLRSDREPGNFTARLGLYSMDNGCTLTAGSWPAAKAASDAAASAAALLLTGAPAVFLLHAPAGPPCGRRLYGRLLLYQSCCRCSAGACQQRHGQRRRTRR